MALKHTNMKSIEFPFLPEGRTIEYVPIDNPFIQAAKEFAREHSLDKTMPTGAAIVIFGEVIGLGANGSDYHELHGCERVKNNVPTGTGYDLCEGCHPKNHAEAKAIQSIKDSGKNPEGADLYLWGHWWCCESCWQKMIDAGINKVFLAEESEVLFNKNADGNIVGHQFES